MMRDTQRALDSARSTHSTDDRRCHCRRLLPGRLHAHGLRSRRRLGRRETGQRGGDALARDGFIPPVVPMDVLYLQRKFGGMFLLGARLRAKLPVRDIMERYLD
jgi:hypothetical protein